MDRGLAESLAAYSKLLWDRGWVANHDGNLSLRIGADRFLATPTGESKRVIEARGALVVDLAGKVREGRLKVFSEWNLHAAAYRVRPDAKAVVHAHPPYATAAGLSGLDLSTPALPEAVVSLGSVPTARAAMPGPDAADAAAELLEVHDALLLPGNGVLTIGDDLEQAYLRMELVEHLAHIVTLAFSQGEVRRLSPQDVEALLEKRAAAGLGPEGRRRRAGAPAPGGSSASGGGADQVRRVALARASALTGDARLAKTVADEVARRLK